MWLIGLILFTLLIGEVVARIPQKPDSTDSEIIQAFEKWNTSEEKEVKTKKWAVFDPNSATQEQLELLDIPVFIRRNILAYRDAGGKFLTASEIRKIYGMNDSLYKLMEPYIKIDRNDYERDSVRSEPGLKRQIPNALAGEMKQDKEMGKNGRMEQMELNSADSVDFVGLRGIGPVFASRIIKYRELLGGYYSSFQLTEVYNFPRETYEGLKHQLWADTVRIKKIRINYAEYRELIRHPYLEKEDVEKIIGFRDSFGIIGSPNVLYTEKVLDSMVFFRIKPYLSSR